MLDQNKQIFYLEKQIEIQNNIIEKLSNENISIKKSFESVNSRYTKLINNPIIKFLINCNKLLKKLYKLSQIGKLKKLINKTPKDYLRKLKKILHPQKKQITKPPLQHTPYSENLIVFNRDDKIDDFNCNKKIAIQVHIFYPDLVNEINECLSCMPCNFDLYISTDTENKVIEIKNKLLENAFCQKTEIKVFENKGRDILPFLLQLQPVINDYDYICHIHTKKSLTADKIIGERWREFLYKHLFGTKQNIENILIKFATEESLGLVYPPTFPYVQNYMSQYVEEIKFMTELMNKLSIEFENNMIISDYPAGNMFWAKTKAIKDIFLQDYLFENIPNEDNQTGNTVMHAVERIWCYLAKKHDYYFLNSLNNTIRKKCIKKRIAFFVHFDKENIISESDVNYVNSLRDIGSEIVFITNSKLSEDEFSKIKPIVQLIIRRANYGYDFGAWKDALQIFRYENLSNYDEVILANNSCYAPIYPIENMFSEMENRRCDFWGVTIHSESYKESTYLPSHIQEHIQSYFLLLKQNVILSDLFQSFFNSYTYTNNLLDTIVFGEIQLTPYLSKYFNYDCYIDYLSKKVECSTGFDYTYDDPASLLIAGSPFVKKKAFSSEYSDKQNDLRNIIKKITTKKYFMDNPK